MIRTRTRASSPHAVQALKLADELQSHFAGALGNLAESSWQEIEWLRNEGAWGGGLRLQASEDRGFFNRASINVSQIQYEQEAEKPLNSATALSAIIHPNHPLRPSIHLHISWTELKNGNGYWRIMADLNPSNPCDTDAETFRSALRSAAATHAEEAFAQGDRYFFIPALNRHRGIVHFYLENFQLDSADEAREFAKSLGHSAIDCYTQILSREHEDSSPAEQDQQLAYHTVYFFQVLLLDRGTTSGLLVHDENDVGILGSLPALIDAQLLASWKKQVPAPQDLLLDRILQIVNPDQSQRLIQIDERLKSELAVAIREHYLAHPGAIELQARGDVIPPTVKNHQ